MSLSLGLTVDAAAPVREGAGFWIRALARIIDLVVHTFTGAVAGLTAGILIGIGAVIRGTSPDAALATVSEGTALGFVAALVGATAMHTLAEGLHGSTLGKRLCGLTVISDDGSPATLLAALKRDVAYFWDSLFFGYIAARKMSQSAANQRYGDEWARTLVVRISSLDPAARRPWWRFLAVIVFAMFVDGVIVFVELASRLL